MKVQQAVDFVSDPSHHGSKLTVGSLRTSDWTLRHQQECMMKASHCSAKKEAWEVRGGDNPIWNGSASRQMWFSGKVKDATRMRWAWPRRKITWNDIWMWLWNCCHIEKWLSSVGKIIFSLGKFHNCLRQRANVMSPLQCWAITQFNFCFIFEQLKRVLTDTFKGEIETVKNFREGILHF